MKIVEKIVARFGQTLNGYTFAVWGLSYKPNTDDMRNAPSIEIIRTLMDLGAKIRAYDPKAMSTAKNEYFQDHPQIEFSENKYDALADCDALLLLTEWKEFLSPDFRQLKGMLKTPIIFDGRNQYNDDYLNSIGIELIRIGN